MLAERRPCFFPFQAGAAVFVHLHCHSHYSFLRGVASPEEIIAAAVEQNMPAVALTDTNGLCAAVQFYKLAQENDSTETDGRPVTMQELAEHSRSVIALFSITSCNSRITNYLSQFKEI